MYPNAGVSGGVDEEEAAVDTSVLDLLVTHGSQLLPEICRVLVLFTMKSRSDSGRQPGRVYF